MKNLYKFVAILVVAMLVEGAAIYYIMMPQPTPAARFYEIQSTDLASFDLRPNVLSTAGPLGDLPLSPADLQMTAEENASLSGKHFKGVFSSAWMGAADLAEQAGAKSVFDQYPGVEVIAWTGTESLAEQLDQIDTYKARGDLSFAIFQPIDATATASAFKSLAASGVVCAFSCALPDGFNASTPNFAGNGDIDAYGAGVESAEMLVKMLKGTGKVGMILMGPPFYTVDMREKGANDTFAKYPNIQVVDTRTFNSVPEIEDLAKAMLTSHPDIEGIWSPWTEGPSTNVAKGCRELGYDSTKVRIASVDCGAESIALALIDEDNPIKAVTTSPWYVSGQNEAKMILKYLATGNIPSGRTYSVAPIYGVTTDNLPAGYKSELNVDLPDYISAMIKPK
jgi:ribose transport system substrate-binding protein